MKIFHSDLLLVQSTPIDKIVQYSFKFKPSIFSTVIDRLKQMSTAINKNKNYLIYDSQLTEALLAGEKNASIKLQFIQSKKVIFRLKRRCENHFRIHSLTKMNASAYIYGHH